MINLQALLAANPYPGLRPFDRADALRFFGRDSHIAELAARLHSVNFLAVTGDSGCGKSSLVRAGLLSYLQAHSSDGVDWQCAVMRPGSRPIAALAQAMAPLLSPNTVPGPPDPMAEGLLYGRLRIGARGLIEAVEFADLGPGKRLLIVVDQFEEIFRFDLPMEEASAFVKLLLAVALDEDSPVSVIITMRSDALGRCADHQGLPEAVSKGQYLVPRLTRMQRKLAIEGPVQLAGYEMDAALMQRLLNDVSGAFDDLPILQHVMSRTWVTWAQACGGSRPIGVADYEAAGTSARALSEHGKQACADLPGLDEVIGRVFRALTERVSVTGGHTRGSEGLEQRRPMSLTRLRAVVAAPDEDIDRVIERFRRTDTGFLASGPALIDDSQIIDISHESLIRQWDRMRQWLAAETTAADQLRLIAQMAQEWHDRDGPLLQRGSLKKALAWRQLQKPNQAWVALCLGQDDEAAHNTVDLVARYLRRSQRGRHILVYVPMLLILIASLVAMYFQAQRAKSAELSTQAMSMRVRYPAQAALLAVRALKLHEGNVNAATVLRSAMVDLDQARIERILGADPGRQALRASMDHSRVLAFGARAISVLDGHSLVRLGAPLQRAGRIVEAAITGDNTVLLTQTEDFAWQGQVLGQPQVVPLECEGEGNVVYTLAVAKAGHMLSLGCGNGDVLVGQIEEGAFKVSHHLTHPKEQGRAITAMAFSQDDQLLAVGDTSGLMRVWRLDQAVPADGRAWIGEPSAQGKGERLAHNDAIVRLHFHPTDNGLLLSASDDGKAVVWRLDVPGRRLAADDATSKWTLTHDRPVADAMFAPPHNNRNPVLTMDGKNVHVWTDETKVDLLGHEDWVTKMAASADGSHFVTASSDGTARVWLVDMAAPVAVLRGHRGAVKHAHFIGGDKQRVLTIGADGQSFLWLLHPTQLLSYTRNKWALGAAFSPDGRRVMLAYENGASVMSLPVDESQAPGEPLKLEDAEDVGLARLSWRPDGQMMLGVQSSSKAFVTNVLQVFAADSGKHLWPGQPSDLFLGTFAPKGFDLLTSNRNGQLQVWDSRHLDAPDLKPLQQFAGPGLGTTAIALSADGRWVAAASEGVIRLWARDKPTDPPLTLQGHEGDVVAMTFSPDSQHLLSASADRTARIWHLQPGGPRPDVLEGNASALTSAAFDATGEKVLTGNARGGIDVWAFHPQQSRPADRLQRMTSLRWHTEMVNSVAFSPDGQWILSASDDGSVRRGTCKTCWMSVAALQDKAANEALVPPAELRKIEQQSHGQIARMLERARSPSQWFR